MSIILKICARNIFSKKLLQEIQYVFYDPFSFSLCRLRLRLDVGDLDRDASFVCYDDVVRKIAPKVCNLLLDMVLLLFFCSYIVFCFLFSYIFLLLFVYFYCS
jgi:hypothetical protein